MNHFNAIATDCFNGTIDSIRRVDCDNCIEIQTYFIPSSKINVIKSIEMKFEQEMMNLYVQFKKFMTFLINPIEIETV